MIENAYIDDCVLQLRKLKTKAEKAVAQVSDDQMFAKIDPESNSIAIIMKHLAGNMRSRWTDFLTSDGEKPDRQRDQEFESARDDTRESILAAWEHGWKLTLESISSLKPEDIAQAVTIRGEAHSVLQAINRQMAHYAEHVGQIILLAKHYAGRNWKTLSIPRGKSKDFDVSKAGERYKT